MGRAKEQQIKEQQGGGASLGDKYVCAKCFNDYALKKFVSEYALGNACDYCGRKSQRLIAASIEAVLKEISIGIGSEWGNPDNERIDFEDGEYQGNVIETYELFYDEIEDPFENDLLRHDIINAFYKINPVWCKRNYYGFLPHEALRYGWKEFVHVIKHARRYFFSVPDEQREGYYYEEIAPEEFLDRLGELVTEIGLVQELPEDTQIFRVRVHNPKLIFHSARELGTAQNAPYSNRMSPAGIPMFYGAFEQRTAVAETYDPSCERSITIGKWGAARKIPVLDLTRIPEVPSIFDSEKRGKRPGMIFLHEFTRELSQPIKKDGWEHIDYVPTQVMTEYFRHIYTHPEYGKLLGILYNSSQRPGGKCCVFFF
ncbi:MAG: HEPN-associated N-terminal domain-containing protein, partial [Deltaproteobacteria bacterium]|nr:HEPN-associated N-terminal domain-containing protein [Deltaproteobacteria bacterium]